MFAAIPANVLDAYSREMDFATHCDQLEIEGARFVDLARGADRDSTVFACPEWTVSDLLEHVGFVHRWAEHLVRVRAPRRISGKDMDFPRGPATPEWLADGLDQLVATLRASDPDDAMWAWGEDQHVRYWARRQLHETLVHRLDLEEARAIVGDVDPDVAADAIDEFFANIESASAFSPAVKNLVGHGEIIEFIADDGPIWTVRLQEVGFQFLPDAPRSDASVRARATELLPVIYRRRTLEGASCVVDGRRDLVEFWLANSALD